MNQNQQQNREISKKEPPDQIRDVIYDYIDATPFEKIIIEDPYFQRLRFIFQNSSAYLTYPSNQLTRFSHSLGVMHIGGLMFNYGLMNADAGFRTTFFEKNRAALIRRIKSYDLAIQYEELSGEWTSKSTWNYAKFDFDIPDDQFFVFHVYWQALRIACLCHDIGHLPFSHIFEMGIDEFNVRTKHGSKIGIQLINDSIDKIQYVFKTSIKRDIKATDLHEVIGAHLLCNIFESQTEKDTIEVKLFKLCLGLGIEMFLHGKRQYSNEDPDQGLFKCYYNLISSDLDADRLDYILRDAKSSGLNLGNFDYTRILHHMKLMPIGDDFLILPSEKSVSSIDQFFNYRYLMYEYVYYHHNVAKYDGILIEILNAVFKEAILEDNATLRELCINRFNLIDSDNNLFPLKRKSGAIAYEFYDDCWLRNFLHEIYRLNPFKDESIENLLETFLFRKKNNAISWAKNSAQIDRYLSDDFFQDLVNTNKNFRLQYFIENESAISKELKGEIDKWRASIQPLSKDKKIDELKRLIDAIPEGLVGPLLINSNETAHLKFRLYLNEAQITKSFITELSRVMRENLRNKGIILITKNIPAKLLSTDPKEAQIIIVKDRGLKFLTEVSFYLRNLKNLSETHFKYSFAFVKKDINDKSKQNEHFKEICTAEVSKFLFAVMNQGLLLKVLGKLIETNPN